MGYFLIGTGFSSTLIYIYKPILVFHMDSLIFLLLYFFEGNKYYSLITLLFFFEDIGGYIIFYVLGGFKFYVFRFGFGIFAGFGFGFGFLAFLIHYCSFEIL